VLIDLERGNLLQTTFKLPVPLAVPDVLYERELRANNGELLRTLGLQVLSLSDAEVTLAQEYLGRARSLSIPDAFALALVRAALATIANHPRCRLPRDLIATYLAKFSK
jgi:hypothetical protein